MLAEGALDSTASQIAAEKHLNRLLQGFETAVHDMALLLAAQLGQLRAENQHESQHEKQHMAAKRQSIAKGGSMAHHRC